MDDGAARNTDAELLDEVHLVSSHVLQPVSHAWHDEFFKVCKGADVDIGRVRFPAVKHGQCLAPDLTGYLRD